MDVLDPLAYPLLQSCVSITDHVTISAPTIRRLSVDIIGESSNTFNNNNKKNRYCTLLTLLTHNAGQCVGLDNSAIIILLTKLRQYHKIFTLL